MRWPDTAAAEASLSAGLDREVRLAVTTRPLSPDALTPGERGIHDRLPEGARRHDWLLGRAALKALLHGSDTSEVTFPHRHLSISHAAGRGVAVAAAGEPVVAGLGVDFEGWRPTDPRTARFFLAGGEQAAAGPDDLLRLWTVKEALFKATPVNSGARLDRYRLADPAATEGTAVDGCGRGFRYVSGYLPEGPLSVAVCREDR